MSFRVHDSIWGVSRLQLVATSALMVILLGSSGASASQRGQLADVDFYLYSCKSGEPTPAIVEAKSGTSKQSVRLTTVAPGVAHGRFESQPGLITLLARSGSCSLLYGLTPKSGEVIGLSVKMEYFTNLPPGEYATHSTVDELEFARPFTVKIFLPEPHLYVCLDIEGKPIPLRVEGPALVSWPFYDASATANLTIRGDNFRKVQVLHLKPGENVVQIAATQLI